jgi:uncharacterized phage infection (PIP) family protein YhgE
MAKKKQSLVNEELPVEETIQEEVIEEVPQVEEEVVTETPVEEEAVEQEETVDPEKVIEEFNEAAKNIDSFVTNTTTQEELSKKLEDELKRASNVEEQLEKQIADLEKKVSPEMKRGFTQFWMGASEGWFN